MANALGRVFFNVAGLTCYKFDYPIKVSFDCNFDIFGGKIQKFVKNLDAIEESMVPNKSLTEVFLG